MGRLPKLPIGAGLLEAPGPPKVVLWSITYLNLVRLLSFTFINTV
jgi:hypothetical protein